MRAKRLEPNPCSATTLRADALNTVKGDGAYALDSAKLEFLDDALRFDLQSNIVVANDTLRTDFLFVRFDSERVVIKTLIADLLEGILVRSSTIAPLILRISRFGAEAREPKVDHFEQPFVNFLLTAHGYQMLGYDPSSLFPPAFCRGPRAAEVLRKLHDPDVLDWEPPYQEAWDALIVLSHDNEAILSASCGALVEYLFERGVVDRDLSSARGSGQGARLHVEHGNMLDRHGQPSTDARENFEIFGFRDGISQPVFLEEHWIRQKRTHYGDREPRPGADPRLPLSVVLAKDPFGTAFSEPDGADFGLGSFFVFRKFEQDYRGFEVRKELYKADVRHRREFLRELYASKHESTPGAREAEVNPYAADRTANEEEFVLSSVIGRTREGWPILRSGEADYCEEFNDFDYEADRNGARCPFSAHIRKANPRGATGDLERERHRRIVRRGIPYGTRETHLKSQLKTQAGLLFFCAQANIEQQFEHIQSVWLNGYSDPSSLPTPGIDSLMGQVELKGSEEQRARGYAPAFGRREGSHLIARNEDQRDRGSRHGWINQTVRMEFDFQEYVELKGAEYLFSPSISGLIRIASGQESRQRKDIE